MVDKKKFRPLQNQSGQALFELIIFIPFLIFLYTIYSTTGDAISGSINQQKAVRGYFYSLIMGNSYLNTPLDLAEFASKTSVTRVGFSALGWREKGNADGTNAFAPCFKFSSLLKNNANEECDSKEREEEGKSRYIRVFTYYGVCGPVYTTPPTGDLKHWIDPSNQTDPSKCSLGTSN
jgi:hypothetical protein